LIFP
jgi:hypothetical protein